MAQLNLVELTEVAISVLGCCHISFKNLLMEG